MRETLAVSKRDHSFAEQLRFLRRLVANPRRVGAIAPSSHSLARAMVAQIDISRPGPILELGPGSGAMTREMLASGIPPERLTVVERDAEFAQLIRERFAGVNVIKGDAFDLANIVASRFTQPFAAIISGIPLLNLPEDHRTKLIDIALSQLAPGAPFIQFSYGLQSPVDAPKGATVEMSNFILCNLPPARVWVYRREPEQKRMQA